MAGWDDVGRIALALPEVANESSYGRPAWKVRGKLVAWNRPLTKKEIKHLGDAVPDGEILGIVVPGEEAKLALLASEPEVYFTTSHFDGHLSVLVRLDRIPLADLEEAIVEAWLAQAPKKLADAYLQDRGSPG
jgi:hypothetical protein